MVGNVEKFLKIQMFSGGETLDTVSNTTSIQVKKNSLPNMP